MKTKGEEVSTEKISKKDVCFCFYFYGTSLGLY